MIHKNLYSDKAEAIHFLHKLRWLPIADKICDYMTHSICLVS